jgi:hypothetical protein
MKEKHEKKEFTPFLPESKCALSMRGLAQLMLIFIYILFFEQIFCLIVEKSMFLMASMKLLTPSKILSVTFRSKYL